MNFCGSVGYTMKGSGLTEAWKQFMEQIQWNIWLVGKAISRALRGHLLTETAHTTNLLKDCPINNFNDLKKAIENSPESTNEVYARTSDNSPLGLQQSHRTCV
jgi:hypothetical protein